MVDARHPVSPPCPPPAPAAGRDPAPARRWSRYLVTALALWTGLLLTLNLLVDPFQVFGLLPLRDSYGPNEMLNKYRHLAAQPTRHDAFLVGSSRMGAFDPAHVTALRPERRYYNLGVLGSRPAEQLALLQALHAAGVTIREVVVGLELYPFLTPPPRDTLTYRLPPEATGESRLTFYLAYLWQVDYPRLVARLIHQFHAAPQMHFDFTGSGRYLLTGLERERAADPQAYQQRYVADRPDSQPPTAPPPWRARAFAELTQLRDWLQAQGITAVYFIHPFHPGDLTNVPVSAPADFVRQLRSLLPAVHDFSRDARFLSSRDYYDYKHYTSAVADGILQALFAASPTASPSDSAALAGGGD